MAYQWCPNGYTKCVPFSTLCIYRTHYITLTLHKVDTAAPGTRPPRCTMPQQRIISDDDNDFEK